jgi:hypothetical protein
MIFLPTFSHRNRSVRWVGEGVVPLCPLAAISLSIVLAVASPALADPPPTEYQVKAAMLLKFAQFINWSESADPISIGVMGEDPFGNDLDVTFNGETIQTKGGLKRSFILKRSKNAADLKTCDILFISRSEKDRIPAILKTLGKASILTVSDIEGFCREGGVITYHPQDGKMKFQINKGVVERHGVNAKTQLLSLGIPVATDPGKGED